jgi:hypothetical protein
VATVSLESIAPLWRRMYPLTGKSPMDSAEKAAVIRRWIDPDERVTVDFEDERDLNAEVVECDDQTVTLVLETAFPHYKQHVTLPLRVLTVGEDKSHYTRDPEKPLRYGRLRLSVDQTRPQTV